jgi:phosphoglycerate dehydrogenase-like enzyme
MTRLVTVLDTGYDAYDQERSTLAAAGCELRIFPGGRHDRAGKLAFAAGAEGILLRWTLVDEEFLSTLPRLRALVRYGVGYDNVDVPACARHGVLVSNVQGYADHSVSDHALALILACARNLKVGAADVRACYGAPPRPENHDLHDQVLGIVGLGHIGGTLARKARNLFARVLACDPQVPPERFAACGATAADLATLCAEADVISLHCDLNETSRGLIGAAAFAAMRRTPILINTARGEVLDRAALAAALAAGRLHSVGLDVFPEEPPGAEWDALLADPRVIATGHYAWHSVGASRELQRRAGENLVRMLDGERIPDCLDPECRQRAG